MIALNTSRINLLYSVRSRRRVYVLQEVQLPGEILLLTLEFPYRLLLPATPHCTQLW